MLEGFDRVDFSELLGGAPSIGPLIRGADHLAGASPRRLSVFKGRYAIHNGQANWGRITGPAPRVTASTVGHVIRLILRASLDLVEMEDRQVRSFSHGDFAAIGKADVSRELSRLRMDSFFYRQHSGIRNEA